MPVQDRPPAWARGGGEGTPEEGRRPRAELLGEGSAGQGARPVRETSGFYFGACQVGDGR